MVSGFTLLHPLISCPTPSEVLRNISGLAHNGGGLGSFGSFSTTVYDTAWLAMIPGRNKGHPKWIFPKCFDYLLANQEERGTWSSFASLTDGILCTLAGLLALSTRRNESDEDPQAASLLSQRIQKAQAGLHQLLLEWDPGYTAHVGFEVLVPNLLRRLDDQGIKIDFPGSKQLMELNALKMKKFHPTMVYSKRPVTILHTLEAFVGLIDFDQVSHHCTEGLGLFGSPAATAAYLTNASNWDTRAERYLRRVVRISGGDGAVPSAYPTSIFEVSWAVSTLVPQALSAPHIDNDDIQKIRSFLSHTLDQQNGVVGFAPGILEDADDTARTLMALQNLGKHKSPNKMTDAFQMDKHFKTYELERNPSFSANCNVLLSLLGSEQIGRYETQIEKATVFLLEAWDAGKISDKWNLSTNYSMMLLAEALVGIMRAVNSGSLQSLPPLWIDYRIPVALCQILSKVLCYQRANGSWDDHCEVTAYGALTVAYCLSLPWSFQIRLYLTDCLSRAREYISAEFIHVSKGAKLWVEKVSYKTHVLEMAYCSAAVHIALEECVWCGKIVQLFSLPEKNSTRIGLLLSGLPIFRQQPLLSGELALIEGALLTKRLASFRDTILTRDSIPMTKDKYRMLIPAIWATCNQFGKCALSPSVLWEMVLLSLFNYQIDELMESVVARLNPSERDALMESIEMEYESKSSQHGDLGALSSNGRKRKTSTSQLEDEILRNPQLSIASECLKRYIRHILDHPSITQHTRIVQQELAVDVRNFLTAHLQHNFDNDALSRLRQEQTNGHAGRTSLRYSYFEWVRSTAADDTSCPMSFRFFACLISPPGKFCFAGPQERYISQGLRQHLATMCRQYNDYGSASRDAKECNMNSLDFPEFTVREHGSQTLDAEPLILEDNDSASNRDKAHYPNNGPKNHTASISVIGPKHRQMAKDNLMQIAQFERSCMQLCFERLSKVVVLPQVSKQLQVFIDVTDVFGQIYVQKDIASRVKDDGSSLA